ncbi:protein of unknown function (DUF4373) [Bacteroides finegoldii]|uniref:Lin1244/Lin1753-like N-terminal domain-containing protein n=1 Tax=Bacteroides finegoldii CL09T03C10 TaxID=997888 RepID=K5CI69_9BACE|nr:DUF4373 domain-containing protein [Bacteroides finegoldii]EKJ89000.1 hypothetical protein HMPREF1057_03753 [Bacteroides finegoldii CL09T03C10]
MARISKPGLDYFPLDVNFLQDRKVRRISCRHHAAGIAALTSLLCLIYKEKGYYVLWNKDTLFDIAQEACCEEEEMQAIIDDCLSVGLFDTYIYKEYGVLTSQAIQEQYHKIIIDSRRKYKLPLENFWMIKEEKEANDNEEETKERKGENGEQTNESAANPSKFAASSGKSAATMPQTKQETDTDIKSKQEMERENEIKSETQKDKETEKEGKMRKESEEPPVPPNGVSQASPVAVRGLSLEDSSGGDFEAILRLNMEAIGIRNEQTAKAIFALARRKELGGINGTLWKILSPGYRPTLLKKNEPGDYILWALNHPAEFESTYNGMLQKMVRGRS